MRKLKVMLCCRGLVGSLSLVISRCVKATTASGDNLPTSEPLNECTLQRERLVMMQAQLEGAQQYITEQCLK